jgi:FkbM family methyltransferase
LSATAHPLASPRGRVAAIPVKLTRALDLSALLGEAVRVAGPRAGLALALELRNAARSAGPQSVGLDDGTRVTLRGRSSDVPTFIQIFLRGELDFRLAQEPRTIVDAGANIGCASIWLARRFPSARILAVEFDRENFEQLRLNTQGRPGVECIHAGLWPTEGCVEVANPGAAAWALFPRASATGTRTVTVAGLLDHLGVDRLDLLKIDIEGSEADLFAGDLRWLDRVGAIAIELHDSLRPGAARIFFDALADFDFSLTTRGEYLLVDQLRRRSRSTGAAPLVANVVTHPGAIPVEQAQ